MSQSIYWSATAQVYVPLCRRDNDSNVSHLSAARATKGGKRGIVEGPSRREHENENEVNRLAVSFLVVKCKECHRLMSTL